MQTDAKHWEERSIAHVKVQGAVLKKLTAGTIQYQFYEEGVTAKTGQGSFAYFHCDNKGCDPTQPMALKLSSPGKVPTNYEANFQVQFPYKKNSGSMKLVFWGSDQDHYPYDFSATIKFQLAAHTILDKTFLSLAGTTACNGACTECQDDSDCPSSYCQRDPTKRPPFTCHACGDNCCNSDKDCPGSYCMNDKFKTAPFTCHA